MKATEVFKTFNLELVNPDTLILSQHSSLSLFSFITFIPFARLFHHFHSIPYEVAAQLPTSYSQLHGGYKPLKSAPQ